MTDYKLLVPFILQWEGGWVNDPADSGGETNRGITFTTYESLALEVLGEKPTKRGFLELTKEDAALFVKHFWDQATAGNRIESQAMAEVACTWNWGSGGIGRKEFQKFLNSYGYILTVDGKIGSQTVSVCNRLVENIGELELFLAACDWRNQFFVDLCERAPKNRKFLKGWQNRLNSFRKRYA